MGDEAQSEKCRHVLDRRGFLAAGAVSLTSVSGCLDLFGKTKIEDWYDLNAVRERLDDDYVLATDLDEQTAGYDEHVGDPKEGWEPIGIPSTDADTGFTGTFDGQGHEIANLRVDRPDRMGAALFVENKGTIKAVTLVDTNITGNSMVGGLVGRNEGRLLEISIREAEITGEGRVGGLIGENAHEVSKLSVYEVDIDGEGTVGGLVGQDVGGEVTESFVREAGMTGESRVGGLIGFTLGDIQQSSVREVDITASESVGGLVGNQGRSSRKVSKSFVSESSITGSKNVGGLVGSNDSDVVESWTAGDVDGEHNVGGLIGQNGENARVTASYWDIEQTGQTDGIGVGDDDVTGLMTDEMHGEVAIDNMDALDFDEVWATQTGPSGYPVLRSLDNAANKPDTG